ncbi:hypothetical protein, partial [Blastopirellula marina]
SADRDWLKPAPVVQASVSSEVGSVKKRRVKSRGENAAQILFDLPHPPQNQDASPAPLRPKTANRSQHMSALSRLNIFIL